MLSAQDVDSLPTEQQFVLRQVRIDPNGTVVVPARVPLVASVAANRSTGAGMHCCSQGARRFDRPARSGRAAGRCSAP